MRLLGRLLAFGTVLAHVHCEKVFGIVGENFTFPVKIDENIVEITWTKNKNKVAVWEGLNKPTYYTSLYNRGLLNKENGSLTIFNLENNDTGTYVLDLDSTKRNYNFTFILAVLAPPSEPEISCNVSGDNLMLKCTADFQKPLNYAWKLSSSPITHQTQEVFIPKEVDASEKATCFIKFSQTEKSSEVFLTQCLSDEGDLYYKRSRVGLLLAFVLLLVAVGILRLLCLRAASLQAVDCKNEKPELELSVMQNSTVTSKCAADPGVTEGESGREHEASVDSEVVEDAEGGSREHLNNSPSCNKEDLKS